MKHLLILIGLFIGLSLSAQREQANYNVADYFANDSTTFFLGAAKDVEMLIVDFTTVDQDDIEIEVGATTIEKNGTFQSAGILTFINSSGTSIDSVILVRATYASTVKTSAGTRYTTSRIYLHYPDGIPTQYITLTFYWGTAESGRIKIYY